MNLRKFVFTVEEQHLGLRLDKALSLHPEIKSRSFATALISRGHVVSKGKKIKASQKVKAGDKFEVELLPIESFDLLPYDLPLDIVFEDADLLVVNKPSGLVVHPAAGHRQKTLVNALIHHSQKKNQKLSVGFDAARPGLVHRIDKDTSGLLVVAKNESALRHLAAQFKKKSTHRVYWCVSYGLPIKKQNTVVSYLRRHPKDRKRFSSERIQKNVAPKGKKAITHFYLEKAHASAQLCLIKCVLETGRTHQIRVHLSEANHPIVADPLYCNPRRLNSLKSVSLRMHIKDVPHLMLHAAELGFIHPKTQKKMLFKVGWPSELLPFLEKLDLYESE